MLARDAQSRMRRSKESDQIDVIGRINNKTLLLPTMRACLRARVRAIAIPRLKPVSFGHSMLPLPQSLMIILIHDFILFYYSFKSSSCTFVHFLYEKRINIVLFSFFDHCSYCFILIIAFFS